MNSRWNTGEERGGCFHENRLRTQGQVLRRLQIPAALQPHPAGRSCRLLRVLFDRVPCCADEAGIRLRCLYPLRQDRREKTMTPTRVLFLDIDGVLNSHRTVLAFNGFPHGFDGYHRERFDWVAVALIRKLCEETGASIVLSSSWRIIHSVKECANGLDLPIFDRTPSLAGCRGTEIHAWLSEHPEITHYAIVDDNSDMLPDQKTHFVQTDEREGLSMTNWADLKRILGVQTDEDKKEPPCI